MATAIGDPDSTRTVLAIIALLVVMGVALVMLAFWLRRQTRPDPELLAPLEMMEQRSWRRGDPVWQRRRLDEVRPAGAVPLTRAAAPPHFDEAFGAGPVATGFDDLHHDAPAVERADPEVDEVAADDDPIESGVVDVNEVSSGFTPIATVRPIDDFSDSEIDPEAVERALADLDAELGQRE